MIHSPFPGMAPCLEAPSIWPDVHTSLMSIFREQLNALLAPTYLAEVETQMVIDHLDDELQIVLPDVSVTRPDVAAELLTVGVVAAPAPIQLRVPMDGPTCLVVVIELQSPVQ